MKKPSDSLIPKRRSPFSYQSARDPFGADGIPGPKREARVPYAKCRAMMAAILLHALEVGGAHPPNRLSSLR